MGRIHISLLLAASVFLLSACGSGRSNIVEADPYTAKQAYEDVKSIVKVASKDTALDFSSVYSQAGSSKSFKEEHFWDLIAQDGFIFRKLSTSQKYALFSLNFMINRCEPNGFEAFGNIAIKHLEGLQVLGNPDIRCKLELNQDQIEGAFRTLSTLFTETPSDTVASTVADFVTTEYDIDGHKNWLSIVNTFSPKEWEDLAQRLINYYDGKRLQKLIEIHIHANNTIPFAGPIALRVTKNSGELNHLVEQIGLTPTLLILRYAPKASIAHLEKEAVQDLMDRLLRHFRNQKLGNEGLKLLWQIQWNQMLNLRAINSSFARAHSLDNERQLIFLEGLHRTFERYMISAPWDAFDFFASQDRNQVDLYWFRHRLVNIHNSKVSQDSFNKIKQDFETYDDQVALSSDYLDKVLRARLRLHLNTVREDRQPLAKDYCKLVGVRELHVDNIRPPYKDLMSPGCVIARETSLTSIGPNKIDNLLIEAKGSEQKVKSTLNIELNSFVMAHDTALFLPAIDLKISVKTADLSYIDLSADQYFANYPVEETPKGYDGLILPVAMILNGKGLMRKSGVRVVPLAYTFQEAWSGQKWADLYMGENKLRDGVSGGNLQIEISNNDLNSFLPTLKNWGGDPQVWDKESVRGGKAWDIDFLPITYVNEGGWLDNLKFSPEKVDPALAGQKVEVFELSFNGKAQEIVKFHEQSNDKNIYVSKASVQLATSNTQSRYKEACRRLKLRGLVPAETDSQIIPGVPKNCLQYIVSQAWDWVSILASGVNERNHLSTAVTGRSGVLTSLNGDAPEGKLDFYAEIGKQGTFLVNGATK